MFKNYFKTAWQNITKSKAYSFINITGLSVGIAVAMLIGLWMFDEFSFDKYHENYNSIAQVMQQKISNGIINTDVAVPGPLAPALQKNNGSDFKHIVISSWTEVHILSAGDKKISFTGNLSSGILMI